MSFVKRNRPPRLAALALLALQACASARPAPLPALPPRADPLAQLPPAPGPLVLPPNVARYPEVRVRRGECPGLPAGILVSPAVYAELHDEVLQRRRLAAELGAVTRLRDSERTAAEDLERAYRARLAELGEAEGSTWRVVAFGLAMGVAGILTGAVLAGRAAPR